MNIIPVDAIAVVDRAVAGFKNVAANTGHRFEAAVASAITVMADENYLYELVSILIDNANKYCDPDGIVSVQLAAVKKNAVLTVTNSYAKGAQVDTKRFFERFYWENKAPGPCRRTRGMELACQWRRRSFTTSMAGSVRSTPLVGFP